MKPIIQHAAGCQAVDKGRNRHQSATDSELQPGSPHDLWDWPSRA